MIARKPAGMGVAAIAVAVIGIILVPCFGLEMHNGLRYGSNLETKQLVEGDPYLLRGDSSSLNAIIEKITIKYDISNDCGLDAQAVMNEVNNNLKEALVAATKVVTIGILDEKYGGGGVKPKGGNNARPGVHRKNNVQDPLAYYSDEHPVVISNTLDINSNCDAGNNCLLVVSEISVVLEHGGEGDTDAAKDAVVEGMKESFRDGSFYGAIPVDTVLCPGATSADDGAIRLVLAWSALNQSDGEPENVFGAQ